MKCFVCGSKCVTKYHKNRYDKIIAVSKACSECDWHSYPTKLPKPIK